MTRRSWMSVTALVRAAVVGGLAVAAPAASHAQTVDVTGTIRDAITLQPIADAVLRFGPTALRVVSDTRGVFSIQLRPATYEITVEHLAYGSQTTSWTLSGDSASATIEIRIEQQAIELPEVQAEAPISKEERERRAEGAAVRRISREQLEQESARGRKLADVLRSHTVGLRIHEGMYYTRDNPVPTRLLCIEAGNRGRTSLVPSTSGTGVRPIPGRSQGRACEMVPVFRDGIRVADPGPMLIGYRLEDLDRVEWLSAVAAAARFGLQAENKGVLLLHTRTGSR